MVGKRATNRRDVYLIDTDHMSLIQRGGEEADRILERIRLVPRDDIAVTVLSFEEQMRGWLAQIAQQKEASSQVRAYGELKRLLQSSGMERWISRSRPSPWHRTPRLSREMPETLVRSSGCAGTTGRDDSGPPRTSR